MGAYTRCCKGVGRSARARTPLSVHLGANSGGHGLTCNARQRGTVRGRGLVSERFSERSRVSEAKWLHGELATRHKTDGVPRVGGNNSRETALAQAAH